MSETPPPRPPPPLAYEGHRPRVIPPTPPGSDGLSWRGAFWFMTCFVILCIAAYVFLTTAPLDFPVPSDPPLTRPSDDQDGVRAVPTTGVS